MKKLMRTAAAVLTGTLVLTGCTAMDLGQEVDAFPSFNSWTTYGSNTATYADLAAVANTISSETDTQVRITTSDTAVGRLTPLRKNQATIARTGDEYMYAYYGEEDFATEEWGPQDLRMVWAPVSPHSLMVTEASGVETPMDLEGKKVPVITANPSVNNKYDALHEVTPTIDFDTFTSGPGQAAGQEDHAMYYTLPLVSYEDLSDSQAYQTARAVQDHYPDFKDATMTTVTWDVDHAVVAPVRVPFHEGTVRYLEEQGVWTPEAQALNEALISHGEELRAAWPEFLEQADTQGDMNAQWADYREENLPPVPTMDSVGTEQGASGAETGGDRPAAENGTTGEQEVD
ncbi:TAXI family TRAP transporter solute-binding subunit [Brevibacterium litoralis]|uniref:TAXI family TRAP transporter solute-binding subunit n=1 Tax=Brevibacterium litoralis TaxID=3138935 RepID=UPI0032EECD7C